MKPVMALAMNNADNDRSIYICVNEDGELVIDVVSAKGSIDIALAMSIEEKDVLKGMIDEATESDS